MNAIDWMLIVMLLWICVFVFTACLCRVAGDADRRMEGLMENGAVDPVLPLHLS